MALQFEGGKQVRAYSCDFNNIAYANNNGISSGCEVTESSPTAMTVDVASGKIFFGNDEVDVSASSGLSISAADSSYDRIDLIAVNSSGTISVLEGTAASVPIPVDYDPDTYIVLARVLVETGVSEITTDDITDTRVLNIGGGGSGGGAFARHIESFTSQTSVTVTHNLGDDEPIVAVYNDSDEEVDPASVTINDLNSLTVTFSTSTSGKIVVFGGVGLNNGFYKEDFTSSTSWSVAHNLNQKYPNVTVYNSSDEVIEPDTITAVDEDNLTITFGVATAGTVIVTGGIASNIENFNNLKDTPNSYSGQSSQFVAVKSDESGLQFSPPAPVGAVFPWLKSFTNTPSLPEGWLECNGQTVNDSESPYDGQTLPDLNGDNRFLRGNSTSGGTGGAESISHSHSMVSSGSGPGGKISGGDTAADYYETYTNTQTQSNLPPYYNVVWIIRVK